MKKDDPAPIFGGRTAQVSAQAPAQAQDVHSSAGADDPAIQSESETENKTESHSDPRPGAGRADNVETLPAEPQGPGGPLARKWRGQALAAQAELEALRAQFAEEKTLPVARQAHMKPRHWGVLASFCVLVLAPLLAAVFYLFVVAEDQYASVAGFTVRSQENTGANDLLGGLASFAGHSVASDGDILYEFIQSQEMVAAVEATTGFSAHYAQNWPKDWAFALWSDPTIEDLTWYWQRIVRISYDSSSGLTEVQVQAYDPETAQRIMTAIVEESQTRINALNEQARADAMGYAQADLDEALEAIKNAREALTQFRTRTRIVDPEADIQGRMGVMNNLQQQLAETLVQYDLLRGTVGADDVRLKQAQTQIDVIRDRINIERQTFASSNTDTGGVGEDYPSLISEFERLSVDREYAEEVYRATLTAFEAAKDEANRQSLYLATYINPTRAQEAEYPQRYALSALIGVFLLLIWSIAALIFYSIRDRS